MSFRYSTISNFYKCPKYYELKHIRGLSDGIEKSGDVAYGSSLHAAIQDLYEGGDGFDVFRAYWATYKDKDMEYSRLGFSELRDMGMAHIEIFRDEHMHKFVVLKDSEGEPLIERKMSGSIGTHNFSGTVDMVCRYKNLITAMDWKTAAYPYDTYKIHVNEQLYGYVHLLDQQLDVTVEQVAYGVFVKDPKNPRFQIKTAPVNAEVLANKLANIIAVCNNLESAKKGGVFTKNPTQCVVGKRVCPFYSKCHSSGGASGQGETP